MVRSLDEWCFSMSARDGIVLTTKQISLWREEEAQLERERANDAKLERELNERNQRRKDLRRLLEAADVFANVGEEDSREPSAVVPHSGNGADDHSDSIAADFVANLRETGDSLKAKQARQRLIDIGYEERGTQPNYIYGLLNRLVKSQKLIKRGSRYRAAPIASPEGEAGAVGAPVRN
jgi:hypothetical protein